MLTPIYSSDRLFVPKGWGWEDWVCNHRGANYCMKRMFIRGGKCGSLHCHRVKHETILVLEGTVDVDYVRDRWQPGAVIGAAASRTFSAGDAFYFSPGDIHRLRGASDVLLLESSTFHAEEDVVRFQPGDLLPGQTVELYRDSVE